MTISKSSKIESTELGGLESSDVLGVLEVKTVLIKVRDGLGKNMIKFAIAIPGGSLYLLDERAINTREAQTWLRNKVFKALGME